MSTAIKFTPLIGGQYEWLSCFLLEVGNFVFLLDCGWNDSFETSMLDPVKRILPKIDAVLISHPDPGHLSALPYLVGRCGLRAPVYTTSPVHKMGQMFMYDLYQALRDTTDFDTFNLDDVDAAFALIKPLRYFQTVPLQGKGAGFAITPHPAGHLLGGCLWRIAISGEEIVYAPVFNNKKDRHLAPATLQDWLERPALLIAGAGATNAPRSDRKRRDREFLDTVVGILRADGNVLVPVDTAGRVLELLLLLDDHWKNAKLPYNLALISSVASSALEFAKSSLEWMAPHVTKAFEVNRDNPFSVRCVRVLASIEDLGTLSAGPSVVLASLPSLTAGAARHLMAQWARDPRNAIIFTERAQPGTLAYTLQSHMGPGPLDLSFTLARRVPLEGEEREEWDRVRRAGLAGPDLVPEEGDEPTRSTPEPPSTSGAALNPLRSNVSSLSKLVRGGAGNLRQQLVGEIGESVSTGDVLLDGFKPPEGCRFPLFPDEGEILSSTWDEYGSLGMPGGLGALGATDMDEDGKGPGGLGGSAADGMGGGEEEVVEEEVPTKVVTVVANVRVFAQIRYFDFEGVCDGPSLATTLAHVAPRNLVLINGAPGASQILRSQVQAELGTLNSRVHTPVDGETVCTPLSASLSMLLSDALLKSLKVQKLQGGQVAWVEGVLGEPDAKQGGIMPLLPQAYDAGTCGSGAGGVLVGNVQLSDLKMALIEAGISAEFQAGVLVAAGAIIVSDPGGGASGHLVMEGPMGEDFHRIRDLLYSMYSVC